eukprot:14088074-Ditylum_brightwellii.AAC.1
MDGKLPAATTASLSYDSNDESDAGMQKNPHSQDGISEDPTPQQCCTWAKEGTCSSYGGEDYKER